MTVPVFRSWGSERLTAVLLLIAGTTAGIAATNLLIGLGLAVVPLCLLVAAWVLVGGKTRLAAALLVAVFFAGWLPPLVTIGGLNLKLHEVLLPIVVAAVMVQPSLVAPTPWLKRSLWLCLVLWSTALIWTILRSQDLPLALSHVALLGLNLFQLLLFLALVADRERALRNSVLALGVATIGAQVWTVLMMLGAEAGIPAFQQFVFFEQLTVVTGAGTTTQAVARNTLGVVIGSFSAAVMAIFTGLSLSPRWRPKPLFLAAGLAAGVGVVAGMARGPLAALGASGLVYIATYVARGRFATLGRLGITFVALGVGAYATAGLLEGRRTPVREAFVGKAVQLVTAGEYQKGTAGVRRHGWGYMLDDVIQNPIVGQGYDTYRKYFPPEHVSSENFPLEILHTTGLIGFTAYALLLAIAWFRAWRFALSQQVSTLAGDAVLPLLAGHVGLSLASATNPLAGGAIYWVLLALLIAATELAIRSERGDARRSDA